MYSLDIAGFHCFPPPDHFPFQKGREREREIESLLFIVIYIQADHFPFQKGRGRERERERERRRKREGVRVRELQKFRLGSNPYATVPTCHLSPAIVHTMIRIIRANPYG